ncbi:MAG: hypothetical protein HFG26_06305 [Provencibacterium sp.]|jgi:lysophospholipase L1-like esterase|nr:hypothetical protein [Provencibacterium sp.]
MQRRRSRCKPGALAALLIALVLAALVPAGAILAKEYLENESVAASGSEEWDESRPLPPEEPPSSREEPEPSQPEEPAPEKTVPAFGLVPEGEPAASSYFDDAVFFGDSLTDGLGAYSVLNNATFIASTGVNPDSVFTKEAITLPGEEERLTMFSALGRTQPGKIYIMIGANWVGRNTGIEKKTFLSHYRTMLERIAGQHPDALIFIQSMLPVSREYEENANGNNHVGLTNEIINEYNEALLALAQEMQLHYLDVHSALADAEGYLPSGETSDGMHLTPGYYTRWYDYLTTHTVPDTGAPQEDGAEESSAPEPESKEPEPPESSSGSTETDLEEIAVRLS